MELKLYLTLWMKSFRNKKIRISILLFKLQFKLQKIYETKNFDEINIF